jgi:hypothetical protein
MRSEARLKIVIRAKKSPETAIAIMKNMPTATCPMKGSMKVPSRKTEARIGVEILSSFQVISCRFWRAGGISAGMKEGPHKPK